jgi:hypothetical protein
VEFGALALGGRPRWENGFCRNTTPRVGGLPNLRQLACLHCRLLYNDSLFTHNPRTKQTCFHAMLSLNTPANDPTELLQHLALERVSPQWANFLGSLGQELGEQLSADELRHLLFRLGSRFAENQPLGACADLAAVEVAINRIWGGMRWGYVALSDLGQRLRVVHRACPLPAALQIDADVAAGYLEGAYGIWLHAAGAPAHLVLRQQPATGVPMQMVFELTAR